MMGEKAGKSSGKLIIVGYSASHSPNLVDQSLVQLIPHALQLVGEVIEDTGIR